MVVLQDFVFKNKGVRTNSVLTENIVRQVFEEYFPYCTADIANAGVLSWTAKIVELMARNDFDIDIDEACELSELDYHQFTRTINAMTIEYYRKGMKSKQVASPQSVIYECCAELIRDGMYLSENELTTVIQTLDEYRNQKYRYPIPTLNSLRELKTWEMVLKYFADCLQSAKIIPINHYLEFTDVTQYAFNNQLRSLYNLDYRPHSIVRMVLADLTTKQHPDEASEDDRFLAQIAQDSHLNRMAISIVD